MNPLLLSPLLEFGSSIITRLFPDPAAKAAAEMELLKLTTEQDFKTVIAQLEINAKEAMHPSIFVAGWRPATGWMCVAGLAYATIFHNLLEWLATVNGWPVPPAVDTDTLIYLLSALLGVAGLRSFEKKSGVTK